MPRCILFANGFLPDLQVARRLVHPGDFLIAADGGTAHALALGFLPRVVIGDLDSLTLPVRQRLEEEGVEFHSYPCDKAETDLELALAYACNSGRHEILYHQGGRRPHAYGASG